MFRNHIITVIRSLSKIKYFQSQTWQKREIILDTILCLRRKSIFIKILSVPLIVLISLNETGASTKMS